MKKRILAILLTLAMFSSVMMPLTVFAVTDINTFSVTGDKLSKMTPNKSVLSSQSNTEDQDEVIEISTPEQLDAIRNNLDGSYKLINDIDLSSYGNWTPIGTASNYFSGTFDGNNHVISNMTVDVSSNSGGSVDAGLFGYLYGGMVKNLGMVGANVKVASTGSATWADAGAVAGHIISSTVENCFNSGDGNISGSSSTNGYAALIGGIVGYVKDSTVSNCFNTTAVSADSSTVSFNSYAGGIVGADDSGCEILNCYNTGEIYAYTSSGTYCAYSGGIAGYIGFGNSSAIRYCYSLSPITADSEESGHAYSGGIAGANNTSYPSSATNSFFLDNVEKPIGNDSRTFSTMYALTAEQMHQKESFIGFDFVDIWEMPDGGIPTLRGIPGGVQPTTLISLFLSHKIVKTEEYIKDTEYGTFMFRNHFLEITAEVSNKNLNMVNNLNLQLELPDGLKLSDDETAIKALGDVEPFTTNTVKWSAEYLCMNSSPDVNLEYTVTVTSDNTETYSNFGSIFIHGFNTNSNILDFSKDTWSFENYSVKPIPVLGDDLAAFKYGMSNASKEAVDRMISSGAGGQCAGMAITAALAKVGRLNLHQIQSNAANLHAISKNERAQSVIGYYYLSQFLSPYQDNKIEFQRLSVQERLSRIADLADAVDSGSNPFVIMFGYQNPDDEDDNWGHAVTAYSLEHGNFTVGGFLGIGTRTYDTRVLIYDNNSPKWDSNYCLYFNEGTDEWEIPAYSDANQLRGAFSDINLMDAHSLDMNKKNVRSFVRAQGNMKFRIATAETTATLSQIANNSVNGVIAFPDDTENTDSKAMNIFFDNSEQPFTIQPDDSDAPIDLAVNYKNYYMAADAPANADAVKFNPSGTVGIDGNVDNFNLVMTGNDGYNELPWHTITASGDSAQNPTLSKASDGYILNGSQFENITVNCKNDEEIKEITFSTDEDSVFIGETEGELEVYVDENDDGTYETLLASNAKKWWEKLSGWLQLVLRYVFFGWIWMR